MGTKRKVRLTRATKEATTKGKSKKKKYMMCLDSTTMVFDLTKSRKMEADKHWKRRCIEMTPPNIFVEQKII